MAGRPKGHPKTGGRVKGTGNVMTTSIRHEVLHAFSELQADSENNLVAWAKKKPTEFYQIASKLIPTEINARINKVSLEIVRIHTTTTQ